MIQVAELASLAVAQFGTPAVAHRLIFTNRAFGMTYRLLRGKVPASLPSRDLRPRIQMNIAKLPVLLHEKVAWKDVSVMLDNGVAVAGFVHGACAWPLSGYGFRDIVE